MIDALAAGLTFSNLQILTTSFFSNHSATEVCFKNNCISLHHMLKLLIFKSFFSNMSLKFYNTYYGLHYLQELLYNTTGTKTPGEQEAVSTPRE